MGVDSIDWRDDALCAELRRKWDAGLGGGVDPDLFFQDTDDPRHVERLQNICARCPVRPQCLEEALAFDGLDNWGVFAGLTPGQRRKLRKAVA